MKILKSCIRASKKADALKTTLKAAVGIVIIYLLYSLFDNIFPEFDYYIRNIFLIAFSGFLGGLGVS